VARRDLPLPGDYRRTRCSRVTQRSCRQRPLNPDRRPLHFGQPSL